MSSRTPTKPTAQAGPSRPSPARGYAAPTTAPAASNAASMAAKTSMTAQHQRVGSAGRVTVGNKANGSMASQSSLHDKTPRSGAAAAAAATPTTGAHPTAANALQTTAALAKVLELMNDPGTCFQFQRQSDEILAALAACTAGYPAHAALTTIPPMVSFLLTALEEERTGSVVLTEPLCALLEMAALPIVCVSLQDQRSHKDALQALLEATSTALRMRGNSAVRVTAVNVLRKVIKTLRAECFDDIVQHRDPTQGLAVTLASTRAARGVAGPPPGGPLAGVKSAVVGQQAKKKELPSAVSKTVLRALLQHWSASLDEDAHALVTEQMTPQKSKPPRGTSGDSPRRGSASALAMNTSGARATPTGPNASQGVPMTHATPPRATNGALSGGNGASALGAQSTPSNEPAQKRYVDDTSSDDEELVNGHIIVPYNFSNYGTTVATSAGGDAGVVKRLGGGASQDTTSTSMATTNATPGVPAPLNMIAASGSAAMGKTHGSIDPRQGHGEHTAEIAATCQTVLELTHFRQHCGLLATEGCVDLAIATLRMCNSGGDKRVSLCVEILWNLVALAGKKTVATLTSRAALDVLHHVLVETLALGFKAKERDLRNDILVVLALVVQRNAAAAKHFSLGFVDLLLALGCGAEREVPHPHVKRTHHWTTKNEDLQLKLLAWIVLTNLAVGDPETTGKRCFDSGFYDVLVSYVNIQCELPAVVAWSTPQLLDIQGHVLTHCKKMMPIGFKAFAGANGPSILYEYIAHCPRVALRDTAVSVLAAAAQTPARPVLSTVGCITLAIDLLKPHNASTATAMRSQKLMRGSNGMAPGASDPTANSHIPVELRLDCLTILADVVARDEHFQRKFTAENGVQMVLTHLVPPQPGDTAQSADVLPPESVTFAAIDAVWSCIVGCDTATAAFLELDGVESLLVVLEAATEWLQPVALSCLADLLQDADAARRARAWRSPTTGRTGAQLLLSLWSMRPLPAVGDDLLRTNAGSGPNALQTVQSLRDNASGAQGSMGLTAAQSIANASDVGLGSITGASHRRALPVHNAPNGNAHIPAPEPDVELESDSDDDVDRVRSPSTLAPTSGLPTGAMAGTSTSLGLASGTQTQNALSAAGAIGGGVPGVSGQIQGSSRQRRIAKQLQHKKLPAIPPRKKLYCTAPEDVAHIASANAMNFKVYACMAVIGFSGHGELEAQERATLVAVEEFVALCKDEVWECIEESLAQAGVMPTGPDVDALQVLRAEAESRSKQLHATRRALQDIDTERAAAEEHTFYQSLIKKTEEKTQGPPRHSGMTITQAKIRKAQMLKQSFKQAVGRSAAKAEEEEEEDDESDAGVTPRGSLSAAASSSTAMTSARGRKSIAGRGSKKGSVAAGIDTAVERWGLGQRALRDDEFALLQALNKARTSPLSLIPLIEAKLKYLDPDGHLFRIPGKEPEASAEGVQVYRDAIQFLKTVRPIVTLLDVPLGLLMAARDHAEDLSARMDVSPDGEDGSTAEERMARYGEAKGGAVQLLGIGHGDPLDAALHFVVDDGAGPLRPNRTALFDPDVRFCGPTLGRHCIHEHTAVVVMAHEYIENTPEEQRMTQEAVREKARIAATKA